MCEVCTMVEGSRTLRISGTEHPELAGFTMAAPCPYTSTLTMNFFLALARLKIRREGQ
jgi:hypothetical protein